MEGRRRREMEGGELENRGGQPSEMEGNKTFLLLNNVSGLM